MTSFLRFAILLLALTTCVQAQVHTIYEIQHTTDPSGNSPLVNDTIYAGGIVTAVGFDFSGAYYFVADRQSGPWSGILVSDFRSYQRREIVVGDSIRVRAKVEEQNSQTRLKIGADIDDYHVANLAASVSPTVMPTGGVEESAEGTLVEFRDVRVVTVGNGAFFTIDDGSGPFRVRRGWTITYGPRVGDTLRFVRGIVTDSSRIYSVNPRDDYDLGFSTNRPPGITNVSYRPLTPTDLDPDTITALMVDETRVEFAFVKYRFRSDCTFVERRMYDDGEHGDGHANDGVWGGVIPPGPMRSTCQFYLSATDDANLTTTSPANAPEATYAYFVRASVASLIFDIQYTGSPNGGPSPFNGETVTVTGIVTGTQYGSYRDGFFMSDPGGGPWRGVLVYDPSLTPVLGDCVRVTGDITEYSGLTEFDGGANVTVLGRGVVPEPELIVIGQMTDSSTEAYEGVLCHVGQCVVSVVGSDWDRYRQFNIRDATGQGTVVNEFGFEYEPAVGDTLRHIVGCVTYHSTPQYMIAPRNDLELGLIDHRPPTIDSVGVISPYEVNVRFNERLDSTGIADPLNYRIVDLSDTVAREIPVQSAYLFSTARTIHVEALEILDSTRVYRMTIARVADTSGNVLENAQISFHGYNSLPYTSISVLYDSFGTYNGRTVMLRGVVNFVQDVTTTSGTRRISAYMQDESGRGFSLSQGGPAADFPGIQRGNLIEIHGRVSQYEGTIQLQDFSGSPTGNDVIVLAEHVFLPQPITVRTGDRHLQSQIVRTSDPELFGAGTWVQTTGTIYSVAENVGGGTNIAIDDGTGSLTIRVWDSMNLDTVYLGGQPLRLRDLEGKTCSVSGPSSTYLTDFQMLAGYSDDFTLPNAGQAFDDLVLDVPNRPFAPDIGQTLRIYYNVPGLKQVRLRIFNLRGHLVRTLVDKPAGGPNVIEWDGRNELRELLPMGTYILHLEAVAQGDSDTKIKPIVIGTKL